MNWISRNINFILMALFLAAPFAIMTGCEKQASMDMARAGQ